MDTAKVIGFRKVDFTDEKTKQKVEGYTLYLIRQPESDAVIGTICEKLFISSRYVDYVPALNDDVVIRYNRYGKVSSIETC